MKNSISKIVVLVLFLATINTFCQQDKDTNKSNIQTYTPSKLLDKGQWDIKLFNNLYTETKARFNGIITDKLRENYFTTTFDIFTGVSDHNRINVGLLVEIRSNTIGGGNVFSVFKYGNETGVSRSGLSSIAPAIKFQPLENIGNFSILSAFHIPIIKNESENNVFLDQTAYLFQNRFFYDYTLPNGDWQLFTELNTEYNFGEEASFANKTFVLAPGVFMSYFPNNKSTILGFIQHYQRFGDFSQDFSSVGFGGKYQLTEVLNLEVLYSKFVRGEDTGLGQSFNIGLRALF